MKIKDPLGCVMAGMQAINGREIPGLNIRLKEIDKIRHDNLARSFKHLKWDELPLEVLRQINDIIGSHAKKDFPSQKE